MDCSKVIRMNLESLKYVSQIEKCSKKIKCSQDVKYTINDKKLQKKPL